jgi:hypothetical protein
VVNNGSSDIFGSVAGSIATPVVTGFPPGTVTAPGVLYLEGVANGDTGTPFGDALAAYDNAESLTPVNEGTDSLGTGDLGSLTPGVYTFNSATVLLNGILLLDAQGSDTASWTFQIPFALTTAGASSIELVDAPPGDFTGNITWVVGSAATLGDNSEFLGSIISQAAVVLDDSATLGCGRAISLNASVTLNTNTVDTGCVVSAVTSAPEPGTLLLFPCGLFALVFLMFHARAHRRSAPVLQ